MVPAAFAGDTVTELAALCERGDILIDGGNSYYRDDVDRADGARAAGHPLRRRRHERRGVRARAGLLHDDRRRGRGRAAPRPDLPHPRAGRRMRPRARPAATATPAQAEHGYLHCGGHGAGHFVKMVHNGIEYGMMAAYAEGLNDPQEGRRRHARARQGRRERAAARPAVLPVRVRHAPTSPRSGGAAASISSWLLDLTAKALHEDPTWPRSRGRVSDSGEGRWTVLAAIDEGVPAHVLASALYERFSSRARPTSRTSCCRPCASSSAATSSRSLRRDTGAVRSSSSASPATWRTRSFTARWRAWRPPERSTCP